ncbi:MAG: hypothetical protein WD314_09095 [Trueperaceae bacterium]
MPTGGPIVGQQVWKRFRRNRLVLVGLAIIVLLVLVALFVPYLAPRDPSAQSLLNRRAEPDNEFVLGADEFGRDILSRLIFSTRITLAVSDRDRDSDRR